MFTLGTLPNNGRASRRDAKWAWQGLIEGLVSVARAQLHWTLMQRAEIRLRNQISGASKVL